MKGIDFSALKERLKNPTDDLPNFPYEFWVNKTAKLLKKPYIQVHGIIAREELTLEEIVRRYNNATKHNGDMLPEVYWWWRRRVEYKNEKEKSIPNKQKCTPSRKGGNE